ncbi:ABC transporter family substrate-binding protein [Buchananella hordeovulneris]|uniref:Solute-binding protein family 5 domain-containing protein n=1 Tax=Buchananella hordeovulneris TaxID=52770 RepID=A0A1Q5PWY3_9ACTO|nr:ABC transporter family substrate-binding protein [Buchananella hordeovulneris]OKL51900.1 hypothetical protein BSZ40_05290 [Buchananella hordeovulneris]
MRLYSKAAAVAAIVGLALAGCSASTETGGGQEGGAAHEYGPANINPQDPASLKDGGEFRMAIETMPDQWSRAHVNGNTNDNKKLQDFMLPGNFIVTPEGEFEVNKDFAESAEAVEKDGKTVVTLKLNPKAIWNDGSPITVEDYIATWKAQNGSNKEFAVASTDTWEPVESVEKGANEFEVIITFKSTAPDWRTAAGGAYHRDSMADPKTFNEGQVGEMKAEWYTGPFKVEKYDKAAKVITYVRNEKWWGEPAKLERIQIRAVDSAGQATSFTNAELDYLEAIDASQYELLQTRPDAETRGATSPQWRHFTFNSKAGLLKDVELRRAIVKGIDREAIAESDLAGLPVTPKTLMLGNHFFMPAQAGYQDNGKDYAFDPEKAKAELEALGWKPGADGIREKDGQRLTLGFTVLSGIFTSENEGKLFQEQMKEIGVEVKLDNAAPADFSKILDEGSFEIIAFSWVGTPYPMHNIGQIYGSGSESNYAQIDDPKIDEYVKQIGAEMDVEKRRQLTNEVDKLIWDNVHTLPIYNRVLFTGVPKTLANYGSFGISSEQHEKIGYTAE